MKEMSAVETNKDLSSLSYEEKLERFKEIISSIENGETSLNQTLKIYKEGIELSKELEKELNEFKGKVQSLKDSEFKDVNLKELVPDNTEIN